jgi:hypothetical protein
MEENLRSRPDPGRVLHTTVRNHDGNEAILVGLGLPAVHIRNEIDIRHRVMDRRTGALEIRIGNIQYDGTLYRSLLLRA